MDIPSADLVDSLQTSPVFQGASEEDLKLFADKCQLRNVSAGERIINQDDVGNEMFIIVSGSFHVLIEDKGSKIQKVVKELSKGDIVGELAVLVHIRRIASVQAVSKGKVAVIGADRVDELLEESHSLTRCLLRAMARAASVSFQADAFTPLVKAERYANAWKIRSLLPERVIAACGAVPLDRLGDRVTIGLIDAFDNETRHFLSQVLNPLRPEFVGISEDDFKKLTTAGSSEKHAVEVEAGSEDEKAKVSYIPLSGELLPFEETPVDQFLSAIMGHAVELGATDIHFEPRGDELQVRVRIDGNLVELTERGSAEVARNAVSRIKVISNLDITERRKPQDGSFRLVVGSEIQDVRVGILAIRGGEKAALRLIPSLSEDMLNLNFLIESKAGAAAVQDMFLQPSGLVLVTGPTGSGKTTTVYAGLDSIWKKSPVVNIVTIEDPIDRHLEYANQTQVNERIGQGFPNLLRAVLRQDPDVILIGEIRDAESARIALEAANTGHLVIASLHSHFSHQAITRLVSLGVDPYLIASTLRGIVSQRLVRKNCMACREPLASPSDNHNVRTLCKLGILDENSFDKLRTGAGCEACGGSGERFRTGLFEILGVDDDLRGVLYSEKPPSAKRVAKSSEYLPMTEYAKFLLERGAISPRAALRSFPHETILSK